MPPTAIPGEIYDVLASHVRNGEKHSTLIERNRIGILNGAKHKSDAGIINAAQVAEITTIVKDAEVRDFRPLVYVVPFRGVSKIAHEVKPVERAHPMSIEYRVEALRRGLFDIFEAQKI